MKPRNLGGHANEFHPDEEKQSRLFWMIKGNFVDIFTPCQIKRNTESESQIAVALKLCFLDKKSIVYYS